MTTNDTTFPAPIETTPFGADDPRFPFAKAVALGTAVIGAVRPEQLRLPTPCPDYDVEELLAHLAFVLRRVAAVGRGESALSVTKPVGVAADRWQSLWLEEAHRVQEAWADGSRLSAMIELPFATLPGFAVMGIYTNEVSVHTWDLAHATGQSPAWDDEVLEVGLAAMQVGLPAEHRGGEIPFATVVEVPADAPLIDRLLAWSGRRP